MNGQLGAALALGGTAFFVAFSGAAMPGPYLTVTITRTLKHGKLSAALMLVGHALLEGLLLIAFAFGFARVLGDARVTAVISILGGAVLWWMGWDMLWGAVFGTVHAEGGGAATVSPLGPVVQGAGVSLSNPYWTLWWATIGLALATRGLEIGPLGLLAFFIGHELGDVVWYGAVILAVSKGRHLLSDRPYRMLIGGCGGFLVYLAASFVLTGVGLA